MATYLKLFTQCCVDKAKMCLRGDGFFHEIVTNNWKQIFVNQNNLPPLKHILALPTMGQICTVSVLQPFTLVTIKWNTL